MDQRDDTWKHEILGDFASWLRDLPEERPEPDGTPAQRRALADLYSKFSAMHREIALQNRSTKRLGAGLEAARAALSGAGEEVKAGSAAILDALRQQGSILEARAVAISFLEIRDSLARTYSRAGRLLAPDTQVEGGARDIGGLVDTIALIIRKFDRILEEQRITRIETVGQQFDPATMNAAGTQEVAEVESGTVVGEVRGGFLLDGRVLRAAEVFVNMRSEKEQEDSDGE